MRNMFGIFKISLIGIFILLISQQTYAQCEEELNRISVTDTQIAKYSQVSGKTFTKNQYHELVKSGVYPDVEFSFSVGFSTAVISGIEDPQKRTSQPRSNESYSIILKKLQDKYATSSPSENHGKPVPTKDIYNLAAVGAYLNCMDNRGTRSNSSSIKSKSSNQTFAYDDIESICKNEIATARNSGSGGAAPSYVKNKYDEFIEMSNEKFAKESAEARRELPGNAHPHFTTHKSMMICISNAASKARNEKSNNSAQSQTNNSNQSQQLTQRAQESQQQAQQNQQRADQDRRGMRKTHDPDNEAHDCLMHAKESKQFGGFTNSCNYKVDFLYCNYKPKPGSGADIVDCQKGKMGSLTIGAKSQTDDHTNKNGETYWFACKSPARAVDGEFVEGKGISARCDSADGRANQTRVGSSVKKQQRNPQTISQGPVSVTLIPTNNTSSKCYDIAYENRSDKHVDIFLKFSLTNNKTGEKGTSVWLGDNTNFDGLFGSANTNRLNPKSSMETTKTVMYNHWLMAKNFIFNNQPSDLYGFNNTVENCDDITAEIPSGGLKWNENAYQRHFDACRSPIKRNRPVGC